MESVGLTLVRCRFCGEVVGYKFTKDYNLLFCHCGTLIRYNDPHKIIFKPRGAYRRDYNKTRPC